MHFLNDSMDLGRNKRAEKLQNFVHDARCTASRYAPFARTHVQSLTDKTCINPKYQLATCSTFVVQTEGTKTKECNP